MGSPAMWRGLCFRRAPSTADGPGTQGRAALFREGGAAGLACWAWAPWRPVGRNVGLDMELMWRRRRRSTRPRSDATEHSSWDAGQNCLASRSSKPSGSLLAGLTVFDSMPVIPSPPPVTVRAAHVSLLRHPGTPAPRHLGTSAPRHAGTPGAVFRHRGTPGRRIPAPRHAGTPGAVRRHRGAAVPRHPGRRTPGVVLRAVLRHRGTRVPGSPTEFAEYAVPVSLSLRTIRECSDIDPSRDASHPHSRQASGAPAARSRGAWGSRYGMPANRIRRTRQCPVDSEYWTVSPAAASVWAGSPEVMSPPAATVGDAPQRLHVQMDESPVLARS